MENKDTYQVVFYKSVNGYCPTEEFLESIPVKVRAKVAKWIIRLEECGPDLPRPYADVVRGKIRELRLVFASHQYRFLYYFSHKHIITHGFVKKTQMVQENEIQRANKAMLDFEDRIRKGEIVL
jgi:phage-related protein